MAISREIWVNYIIENLWKDNEFIGKAFSEDQYVLNGAVVHIPQAGAKPTVVKNRSSLPATVIQRTDTDITYVLDAYTTDPTLIKNAETYELSYDKIDSVLGEHMRALSETVADELLVKWAPALTANILRTTGAAILSHLPSATGNRKTFVADDIKAAQKRLNKLNIPKRDRYAVISTEMLSQLMSDSTLKVRDNALELNMKDGTVEKLYGFGIIERSDVLVYTNATPPVVKAVGAAGAATDNDGVLCFHRDAVAVARGSVDFFESKDDPTYYGNIYSAEVRMGGRKRRTNEEGVVAIVQDASA